MVNRAGRASRDIRTLGAFGVKVSIETDDPRLFSALESLLPAFPDAEPGARTALAYRVVRSGGATTVVRGRRTVAVADDGVAAARLVTDLQCMVARRASGLTFVHAGVVAIDGRAIVLPGRSYAGKSTLVAALVAAGASYGSDEFAVVDSAGLVHPYPRPIALRDRSGVTYVRPHGAGAVLSGPVPAGAVVFTAYEPAQPVGFASLSRGETVLRLLQHCLGVRGRPADTMVALHALAQTASGCATPRGEAEPFARDLIAKFSGPACASRRRASEG